MSTAKHPPITMYTTRVCPYCVKAKNVLKRNDLAFTEIDVSDDGARQALVEKSGRRTVPQIYIGEHHVGGCDDLMEIEANGQLKALTTSA